MRGASGVARARRERLDLSPIVADRSPADRARELIGRALVTAGLREVRQLVSHERDEVVGRETQRALEQEHLARGRVAPSDVARTAIGLVRRAPRAEDRERCAGARRVARAETSTLNAEHRSQVVWGRGATLPPQRNRR